MGQNKWNKMGHFNHEADYWCILVNASSSVQRCCTVINVVLEYYISSKM